MLACLLSLGVITPAIAELTVIYDSGQTRSLMPLLSPLMSAAEQTSESKQPAPERPSSQPLLGPADISNLLPIRSPGLYPGDIGDSQPNGQVIARLAQGNPRPFFWVGSDPFSVQWLKTHRETLKSLGAVGLLVQAETEADVRRVANAAQGLSITLGSGSDLAAALGIHHYPVLITRDGIRQ
ncbi:MAG: integrating conjugative element protein [Gammaproteobacteria bacterium]|nr:integrating conjugative element protein [Gammaproteobacteria bacterium]